jgi:hypothetical protein
MAAGGTPFSNGPSVPVDNFTSMGPSGGEESTLLGFSQMPNRRAVLPSSAYLTLELPFVYMRQDEGGVPHCITSVEAKYCMLLGNAISLVM